MLELKRIVQFLAALGESSEKNTIFQNWRFCRQPLGSGQLAQSASVLLCIALAVQEDTLRVMFEYQVYAHNKEKLHNGGVRCQFGGF